MTEELPTPLEVALFSLRKTLKTGHANKIYKEEAEALLKEIDRLKNENERLYEGRDSWKEKANELAGEIRDQLKETGARKAIERILKETPHTNSIYIESAYEELEVALSKLNQILIEHLTNALNESYDRGASDMRERAKKHFKEKQCNASECNCSGTLDFDSLPLREEGK